MTRPVSPVGQRMGLLAAGKVMAKWAKVTSRAIPSKKIPRTIRSYMGGGDAWVEAGGPGGRAAPNAYMFETPGARHPLFAHGPRGTDGWKHWYPQPYRPFLEEAAELGGQEACNVYADVAIARWCRETGWK